MILVAPLALLAGLAGDARAQQFGVQGQVTVSYGPSPSYIATAQPEYYNGRPVYWYNGYWYYQDDHSQWSYYRTEPVYLHQRRAQWSVSTHGNYQGVPQHGAYQAPAPHGTYQGGHPPPTHGTYQGGHPAPTHGSYQGPYQSGNPGHSGNQGPYQGGHQGTSNSGGVVRDHRTGVRYRYGH